MASPRIDPNRKRELLESRRDWLQQSLEKLNRDARRAPMLLGIALLAPVAGKLFGGLAALLIVLCAVILGFTAAYVVWAHQREYEAELKDVRKSLRALGEAPAESA